MFAPIGWALAAVVVVPVPLATAPASAPTAAAVAAPVHLPPVDAKADYQLGGNYRIPQGVRIVSRDRTARPARSAYTICYVNAFQTQPGRLRWWRSHHPRLLLRRNGSLVHDPGWPGEALLDTSTAAKRHGIVNVIGRWVGRCRADGFEAVEPDNLDSFTRSHRLLSKADNLALASRLARRAHRAGLAFAQKNLAGLSRTRRLKVGFDFAVAEECSVYRECGAYRRAYGRHVIEIEYADNGRRAFTRACRQHGDRWSIVYRDRELLTPASRRYRYAAC